RADGSLADRGEVGRVYVRGPSLMQGYFANAEATRVALSDGWLDTGDTGFTHTGELYLYGRAKDIIIVRGLNYSPQDFEHLVDDVPGVRLGCSAAVSWHVHPDDDSESLVLFVERMHDAAESPEALAEAVRARVSGARGLAPGLVVVLEPGTLPRTSSGKIRRGEALRRYRAGELAPPERVSVWRLAKEMVRSARALARADS